MAISVSVKKFSGREYVYICESFRDPITRRPTSRVLHSFGRKDKLLEENPNAMELIEEQAQKLRANTDAYHQTLEQRVGAGIRMTPSVRNERPVALSCTPAPYFQLWDTLGMSSYFTNYRRNHKISYDLNQAVFLACLGRIVTPASKRSTWMNRGRYLFDFEEVKLADLYGSLGVLAERKEYIIRKLNESIGKMYQRDLAIALYDVTTFYFESFTEDELRRRGMSKEHRTQETQVVLGLLVDSEGVPITYELFPGNTAEVGTLLKVVDEFRRQYNIEDVTVIADSGLNQTLNLEALETYGFKYIVGYPPYVKLTQQEQDLILDPEGWVNTMDGDDIDWGVKDVSMPLRKRLVDSETGRSRQITLDARCIATYSRKRYFHDIDELEKKWRRAKELVKRGPAAVKAAGRSGFKAFINVESSDVSVKEDLYSKRKKMGGVHGPVDQHRIREARNHLFETTAAVANRGKFSNSQNRPPSSSRLRLDSGTHPRPLSGELHRPRDAADSATTFAAFRLAAVSGGYCSCARIRACEQGRRHGEGQGVAVQLHEQQRGGRHTEG